MTTTSNRRAIVLPVSSELTPAGLNELVAGIKRLDDTDPWLECTSTTRPGSPYSRQIIRETDTNRLYWWNGSSWIYLQNTDNVPSTEWTMSVTSNGSAWSGTQLYGHYEKSNGSIKAFATTASNTNINATGALIFSLPVAGPVGAYCGQATLANSVGAVAARGYAKIESGGVTAKMYSFDAALSLFATNGTTLTVELFYPGA